MRRFAILSATAVVLAPLVLVAGQAPSTQIFDDAWATVRDEVVGQRLAFTTESGAVVPIGALRFDADHIARYTNGDEKGNVPKFVQIKVKDLDTKVYSAKNPDWTWVFNLGGLPGRDKDRLRPLHTALRVVESWLIDHGSELVDAEQRRFDDAVRQYRSAGKAELPEAARRFRVQAEAAVAEQDFAGAVDKFDRALEVSPWWPAGRFNQANVLATLGDYAGAIQEMKRYLILAPAAPDARQAQDLIYAWEAKAPRPVQGKTRRKA